MAERLLPRLWVLLAAVFLVTLEGPLLQGLDRYLFDRWVAHGHSREELAPWPEDFVTIAVDSRSIAEFRGDASALFIREDAVRMWDRLHALGASLIIQDGQLLTFRTPEVDAAVRAAIERNHVLLPISTSELKVPFEGAEEALERALLDVSGDGLPAIPKSRLRPPLPPFAAAAHGLGHVIIAPDADGRVRSRVPAFRVEPGGKVLPSIELVALARQRGADLRTLRVENDRLLVDGLKPIPLQARTLVLELVKGFQPEQVSARDLLDPAEESRVRPLVEGRIALIYTSAGNRDTTATAIGPQTHGGLLLAHALRTMDAGHAPVLPARLFVFLPMLITALLLAGVLVDLQPLSLGVLTACAPVLWVAFQIAAFRSADVFLPIAWPVLFTAGTGLALFAHKSRHVVRRMETAEARADAASAPRGEIALVFTDVQGSTLLWERLPQAMRTALDLHNALLRSRLENWRGYEVKTEGDAFMLAFASPSDALAWCLDVQTRLLAVDWPAGILGEPDGAQVEGESGALVWRGLRVRMGIHVGTPEPREDPKTGRMDYFGPVVNKAARVSAMAHGGQIVASGAAWDALAATALGNLNAKGKALGTFALKGIPAPEPLHEILAEGLQDRRFAPPPKPLTTGEYKTV